MRSMESFICGFMCYGIPLGTETFVTHMLKLKAEEIAADANKTIEVLSGDRQALWSVLRLSTLAKFEYFSQLSPPSLCEPIASWLDDKLWNMLEAAVGFEVPRGVAGDNVNCPVGDLDRRSYQEWMVRLPIRLHGWGLRSLRETCGPAYLGALETAIPFMAARDKLCPLTEAAWGGEECWGEAAEANNRWRRVLESGCLEGRELHRWFEGLQSEARVGGEFLGEDPDPLLSSDLQGLGGSSVSGATRGQVVEARDMLRSRLLTRALELHRPQKDRHAWAWRQRDKLSSAWLLCLPGGGETLTNEEFTTTAAVNLCLPPPCVHGHEGELIRGQGQWRITIDRHGDTVQATNIPGDHFRHRHDMLKIALYNMCKWAGLRVEMEAFNVFSHLIPQRELARYEQNRQRQAIIPDLRIVLNVGGQPAVVLAECKAISISPSRYRPTWNVRGVDKRAAQLHDEYVLKARSVDRQYVGTQEGQVGPVEAKLLSFERVRGVVFGAFGEASEPVHQLIHQLADSRVAVAGPERSKKGQPKSTAGERAIVVNQLRRKLSVTAVKAQCLSLLGRLEVIGSGGFSEAANRRNMALDTAFSMQKDRASFLETIRATNFRVRRGFGKVD